ncbi:MAG: hypothetical protein H6817_01890 [Phycisphaerales bacterium]|nr:hypothetical protein [Phycisphaerales bacterium]
MRVAIVVLACAAGLPAAISAAAEVSPADFSIVGVRSTENPRDFSWTIVNNSRHAIVRFRASRYLSQEVEPLPGWSGETLDGQGSGGDVEFKSDGGTRGILPGAKQTFTIHDRRLRGSTRMESVEVELVTGEVVTIPDVLCPCAESILAQNLPLIGLGAMFGVFLAVQAIRRKRRLGRERRAAADASSAG